MIIRSLFFVILSCVIVDISAQAQTPRLLSYQGVLADSTGMPKPDGTYNITFRLYTLPSGGGAIWSEMQQVQVKRGLISAILGTVTPIPDSVQFNQQYWFGVQVGADPEFLPRMQLTSAGSSINAVHADVARAVADSSITEGKIAHGEVVKSINNLHDHLVMQGANGASVTSQGDTIIITASGGGGGGIATIQNTDNALSISNPSGPTATVNLKIPFVVNGNVGIGTTTPTSKLEIAAQDGLAITGYQPFLTLRDANAGNARGVIQSVNGGLNLFGNSYLIGSNPIAYLTMNTNGIVGIGSTSTTGGKLDVNGGSGGGSMIGIHGSSNDNYGVYGTSNTSWGLFGESGSSPGVRARTYNGSSFAFYADNGANATNYCGVGSKDYALYAIGVGFIQGLIADNLIVHNTADVVNLQVRGTKNFMIDHPLDPANKTLTHSCIESNERLLMYSGTVITDANGDATISLPSYFQALNINYRYQLTVVGGDFAQSRVSKEIADNQFSIKTDKPNIRICWQVVGDRNDAYSKANPLVTEADKKPEDRGRYLQPELFGQPKEKAIGYHPTPVVMNPDPPFSSTPVNGGKVDK